MQNFMLNIRRKVNDQISGSNDKRHLILLLYDNITDSSARTFQCLS